MSSPKPKHACDPSSRHVIAWELLHNEGRATIVLSFPFGLERTTSESIGGGGMSPHNHSHFNVDVNALQQRLALVDGALSVSPVANTQLQVAYNPTFSLDGFLEDIRRQVPAVAGCPSIGIIPFEELTRTPSKISFGFVPNRQTDSGRTAEDPLLEKALAQMGDVNFMRTLNIRFGELRRWQTSGTPNELRPVVEAVVLLSDALVEHRGLSETQLTGWWERQNNNDGKQVYAREAWAYELGEELLERGLNAPPWAGLTEAPLEHPAWVTEVVAKVEALREASLAQSAQRRDDRTL